jgi:hypothetical protein
VSISISSNASHTRNADGADINDLTESLLLTEKKYTKLILVRNRLILVPYELPFDFPNNHPIATVLYKSYYKRSASINNTSITMSFTGFNTAGKDKISKTSTFRESYFTRENDKIRLT